MSLHKLSNGSWVDLATVTAIRPLPNSIGAGTGVAFRARVMVDHGRTGAEILLANDDQHAQQMADELAELVNAATKPDRGES